MDNDVEDVSEDRERWGSARLFAVFIGCLVAILAVRVAWPTFEQRRLVLLTVTEVAESFETRYRESVRPALERGVDGQPITVSDLCMRNCEPPVTLEPDDESRDSLYRSFGITEELEDRVVGPARTWDQMLFARTPKPTDTVDAETLAALAEFDLGSIYAETAASLRSDLRPFNLNAYARTAAQWILAAVALAAGMVARRRRLRSPLPVDQTPDRAIV